jgi:hypothetical protein
MTRFLTLLAVGAIAGVMYVTAAPGGLHSAGPSAKQFSALSKKVTKLQKQVTSLKKDTETGLGVLALCIMHAPVAVDQVGTSTSGYLFGPPQTAGTAEATSATSALNLAPTTETSPQHRFFALNTSQQGCVQLANTLSVRAAERAIATLAAHH